MSTLEPDVVVIGGGIQGLQAFCELKRAGYSCILVTKGNLGDGQSLHSHDYMHRGYVAAGDSSQTKKGGDYFMQLVKDIGLAPSCTKTLIMSPNGGIVDKLRPNWDKNGLEHHEVKVEEVPEVFRGGKAEAAVVEELNELAIPLRALLAHLAKDVAKSAISGDVTAFHLDAECSRIESLDVQSGQKTFTLRPKFVVFAAGNGTRGLLRSIPFPPERAPQESDYSLYRSSCVHMICIRGDPSVIPPISVFAIECGFLLIANAKEGSKTLLYLTPVPKVVDNNISSPHSEAEVNPSVVRDALKALFEAFPRVESAVHQLEFAVYAGWKQDSAEASHYAKPFAGISNTCVCLPFILPRAFLAAQEMLQQVQSKVKPTGNSEWELPEVPLGRYTHEGCEWTGWQEFHKKYMS